MDPLQYSLTRSSFSAETEAPVKRTETPSGFLGVQDGSGKVPIKTKQELGTKESALSWLTLQTRRLLRWLLYYYYYSWLLLMSKQGRTPMNSWRLSVIIFLSFMLNRGQMTPVFFDLFSRQDLVQMNQISSYVFIDALTLASIKKEPKIREGKYSPITCLTIWPKRWHHVSTCSSRYRKIILIIH